MKKTIHLIWLALAISPHMAQAQSAAQHANQASVAMNDNNFAEAKRLLDIAITQKPEFAEAWVGRGMAASALNDARTARESYERALTLFTERALKEPENANALIQQATVLILLSRVPEAKSLIQRAVRKFPNDNQLKSLSDGFEEFANGLSKYHVTHE